MKDKIINNVPLFVFLSLTWGILMTFIGALFYVLTIKKNVYTKLYKGRVCVVLNYRSLGGVSLGLFSYVGPEDLKSTHRHELGHTIQNAFLGPLFPFIVGLPSIIRAGLWDKLVKRARKLGKTISYDSIWFEGQATRLGNKYFKQLPFGEGKQL